MRRNIAEKAERAGHRFFQRTFEDLVLPIMIWLLVLVGLTTLKVIGKWNLSGYLAIVFFLIIPSVLEKSNEILGLNINPKREIKFFLLTSAIFSIAFVLLLLSVKNPIDIEFFGIKIAKVFPQIPEVKDFKWLIIFFLGVAVPEELFFRGFVQGRLNRFFGRKFELFGVKFGYGLILQSALFMLVHLPQSFAPIRFLVFFPALLFGILREKYNSIFPSVILHAVGNFFVMFVAG